MIINAASLALPLASGSVDACLCSPPFFGALRCYAGAQDRPWPAIAYPPMPGLPPIEIPAQRVALGHEPDPFAFVGHLLQVFREVERVLAPRGCLAVNLGDSYAGSRCGPQGANGQRSDRWFTAVRGSALEPPELAAKNLVLMPWRFALAMQADRWILRSRMPGGAEVMPGDDVGIEPDICWRKKSAMPESVRDRPTVDFEDVLIFSQNPRYFWDQEAGREMATRGSARSRFDVGRSSRRRTSVRERADIALAIGRNMRSVWTINPEPTDENHFSSWPTALASRLIRVMTSERGKCPECGAAWVREVDRQRTLDGEPVDDLGSWDTGNGAPTTGAQGVGHWRFGTRVTDHGFAPGCDHSDDPVPALVLDPFAGLGRTWEAARATGRRFVGVDLGLEYCRLALSRNDLRAMERRRLAERGATITGPLFDGLS